MSRKLPKDKKGGEILAPESVAANLHAKRAKGIDIALVNEIREYELITPLFGGGTETQKADSVNVIRVPGIRGQLRFWWRAIRGGQFDGSLQKMKEAEDEIFGAASVGDKASPSQVQIDLRVTSSGQTLTSVTDRGRQVPIYEISSPYGYAAFPLREKNQGVVKGVSFSLLLSYPAQIGVEVEAALWAWEMFGGIGGRTRRGFGALQLKSYRPDANKIRRDIDEGLEKRLAGNAFPRNVPHLGTGSNSLKVTAVHSSVDEAWKYLLRELKNFRQHRRPVDPETRRPGRSYWPEPDEIRSLTGRHTLGHKERVSTVSKFPRAVFGLPIIFQFNPHDVGDPKATTLEGKDNNQKRMASPVILRPFECANSQAVGLAIVLSGTSLPPSGIILKGAPGDPTVYSEVTETEAGSIKPLAGRVDVLQAFLDRLK